MRKIPIPRHLQSRPLYRGLPIPYVTLIKADGQPDFRVTNIENWQNVVMNRKCQLCAEKLGKYLFFVGGTEAAKGNQYFEPAIHLECMVYAMQVCPFIVGRMEHADPEKVAAQNPDVKIVEHTTFSQIRNPYWVVKKATGYDLLVVSAEELLLSPKGIIYETDPPLHPETMTPEDWVKVEETLRNATSCKTT